ncbi:hypothetical protein ACLOJK_003487 [Asimina triloba]
MISNIEGESAKTNQSGQDLVYILENEKDVSEEEYDEIKGKESSELPKNLVNEMENVLAENRLSGDSTMGYCSSQEEGEVLVLRDKEKAYGSEGANRSDAGKCKKITSDKTVRKSQRVHT